MYLAASVKLATALGHRHAVFVLPFLLCFPLAAAGSEHRLHGFQLPQWCPVCESMLQEQGTVGCQMLCRTSRVP